MGNVANEYLNKRRKKKHEEIKQNEIINMYGIMKLRIFLQNFTQYPFLNTQTTSLAVSGNKT